MNTGINWGNELDSLGITIVRHPFAQQPNNQRIVVLNTPEPATLTTVHLPRR